MFSDLIPPSRMLSRFRKASGWRKRAVPLPRLLSGMVLVSACLLHRAPGKQATAPSANISEPLIARSLNSRLSI
jgi:hypothetical protein